MQPQFGSVQMVAGAYEQELRADAARVRPTRRGEAGGIAAPTLPSRVRRAVGAGLVRMGERLQGAHAAPVIARGAGTSIKPGAAA